MIEVISILRKVYCSEMQLNSRKVLKHLISMMLLYNRPKHQIPHWLVHEILFWLVITN